MPWHAIVEALTPPPDGIGSPSRFERGIAGLTEVVTAKMTRVMDQVPRPAEPFR
jgi:hypothetical protein